MNKPRQRGFTLIEIVIFIVIVSVGLAGILSVMNAVVKSSGDPVVRKQALAIAESLLEEIMQKPTVSPAGSAATDFGAGGARSQYDSVANYAGYNSAAIEDLTGAVIPGLAGYNIFPAVTVAPTTAAQNAFLAGATILAVRVTVSVTGPNGTVITLVGYRAPNPINPP